VYVRDDSARRVDSEKFETIVLADEKVALGVRAFRCVRMTPSQVASDAILADSGDGTPRVLIVDPAASDKIRVLESKDLKASKLFKAMESVSNEFWKEALDKVVKTHMQLLSEQDQLVDAETSLADKAAHVGDDEQRARAVEQERAAIRTQLKQIAERQVELWKLTRRD
jgi:hypothetical protein